MRAKAQSLQLCDLVFHERDERADDEHGALAREPGELVTERLARTSGHDQQNIAPFGGGLADGFLVRAKGAEAEGLLQDVVERRGQYFILVRCFGNSLAYSPVACALTVAVLLMISNKNMRPYF